MSREPKVLSVSRINEYIHGLFSQEPIFGDICVRGEVGTLNYWQGGVIYFTLKDEKSQLSCAMYSNQSRNLSFRLEKGMEVVVRGTIGAVVKSGTYQLRANSIEKANDVGKQGEMLALLKQELSELGMFDPQYKKQIPEKIKNLGVVTARTGAAITDIIKVTKLRNPGVQIILSPAIVQGDKATASVVAAIKRIEKTEVDVIIVGRGGGSDEDLWAFNNREIAQAVFDCPIPVISAVGHERDVTILDLVADARAATPSHAAEMAVFDSVASLRKLDETKRRLAVTMKSVLRIKKAELEGLKNAVLKNNPGRKIEKNKMRLDSIAQRIESLMERKLSESKYKLGIYIERFKGLSPLDKLSQGYAYVSKDGKTLNTVNMVNEGDAIEVFLKDGIVYADVTGRKESGDLFG